MSVKVDEVLDRDNLARRIGEGYIAERRAHDEIRELARSRHHAIGDLSTRKEQALAIADCPHRAVVFRMLDGKPYDDVIWKAIYPGAERPFRVLTAEDA